MNIGIYGGTFDPPHRGHIAAAKAAMSALHLDRLLLIPDAVPPHKALPEGSPTALIVIYQQPGSNAVAVGNEVKAAMTRLAQRFPDGIEATTIVDSTESIDAGVRDIFRTLVIALVLVIAIIYLFIQDWRATIIPLVAIPVSLIGAFALFPLLGFTINIISLLGLVLAIGLVVDDAIVVVEAVQVNIAAGMKPREATAEAMRNVASPIIATTVVLLAVFIPSPSRAASRGGCSSSFR